MLSAIKMFLLPPLNCFVLCGVGLLLRRKWPRFGSALMALAAGILVLLSMPLVAAMLLNSLQSHEALSTQSFNHDARAIVVLTAGIHRRSPEYGGETIGPFGLIRARYGAWLARQTRLPLLVSGGRPRAEPSQGAIMANVVREDFQVPVKWVEHESRNTQENATYSATVLNEQGIHTIYLVTHAWHMPRALRAFEQAGLTVIPAPTGFCAPPHISPRNLLPSWKGLRDSALAMHEFLGLIWYRLRY